MAIRLSDVVASVNQRDPNYVQICPEGEHIWGQRILHDLTFGVYRPLGGSCCVKCRLLSEEPAQDRGVAVIDGTVRTTSPCRVP